MYLVIFQYTRSPGSKKNNYKKSRHTKSRRQNCKNIMDGTQNVISIRYHALPKMMINKADYVVQEAPHSWGFLFLR